VELKLNKMKKNLSYFAVLIFIIPCYLYCADSAQPAGDSSQIELPDPETKSHYIFLSLSVGTPIGKVRDYIRSDRLFTLFLSYDLKLSGDSFLNFDINYFQYINSKQNSLSDTIETKIHNIGTFLSFKYRLTIDSFKRVYFFLRGGLGLVTRPGEVYFKNLNTSQKSTALNFAVKPGIDLTFDINYYFLLSFSYDFQIIFDKSITELFSFFRFGCGFRF
jgi:hypothetical protein